MNRLEKYKDEILKVFIENSLEPTPLMDAMFSVAECHGMTTKKSTKKSNLSNLLDWYSHEHIEPIEISQLEYEILKNLDNKFMYIARDQDDSLFVYEDKPGKNFNCSCWEMFSNDSGETKEIPETIFSNKIFDFVKWEDREPYCIKSILENCKVVEEAK